MSQHRTSWNTSRICFTTKFKTTNVSLGEEVATVPSKSVGLICRLKHFDVHTEKISDGLIVNCATLGWVQGWYISASRQTSPPTSSQKVWFTPVPWVALNSTDAWSLFVSDITLWVMRLSHKTVSATQPWRVNISRRVCCKSRPATSHVIHTVCSYLFVVTRCSLRYGNVNEALGGLCTCFNGWCAQTLFLSYIYSDHTGKPWGWDCTETKHIAAFVSKVLPIAQTNV